MKLTLEHKNDQLCIFEEDRCIYTITSEIEEKLLCIHMKNLYSDEVLSMYQIKRWFNVVQQHRCEDFTVYNKDEKRGELHKNKDGFELKYEGVYYRFYGGYHAQVRTILCFDRERQVAEFSLGEVPSVKFRNSGFNSLFSLLLFTFAQKIDFDIFSNASYARHYIGVYKDELVFSKGELK